MINTNLKKSRVWALVHQDVSNQELEMGREMTKNEVINYLFGCSDSRGETPLDIYVMDRPQRQDYPQVKHVVGFPYNIDMRAIYVDKAWSDRVAQQVKSRSIHTEVCR